MSNPKAHGEASAGDAQAAFSSLRDPGAREPSPSPVESTSAENASAENASAENASAENASAENASAENASAESSSPQSSVEARSFGRYELLDSLGAGGMASVYRARVRGPGGASRTVALKLILPHLSRESGFVRLFLEEMRVAMALSHRNIVQTFDAGEEAGVFFMAMELVRGCSLRGLVRRLGGEPVPIDVALFIGMELCNALHYAHTFRPELTGQPGAVVHRDVSPSNVLLSTDGDVKLTDFGIARATDWVRQTASDRVMGKLAYMAPEQARGRATTASDLFSVGAVLYELFTQRPLRQGLDLSEVLAGPEQVVPISRIRPELSLNLEQLIMQCLSPDTAQRPSSAEALREALGAELFELQVRSGKPSDAHGRLASYLQALGPLVPPRESSANRLAEALLAEARGVKTAVGQPRMNVPQVTAPQLPGGGPSQPLGEAATGPTQVAPRVSAEVTGAPAGPEPPDPETQRVAVAVDTASSAGSSLSAPAQASAPGTQTRQLLDGPRWWLGIAALALLLGGAGGAFWWMRSPGEQGSSSWDLPPGVAATEAAAPVPLAAPLPSDALTPKNAGEAATSEAATSEAATSEAATSVAAPALATNGGHVAPPDADPSSSSGSDNAEPRAVKGASPANGTAKGRGQPVSHRKPRIRRPPRPHPPLRTGQLAINSVPWSRVYVDGTYRGDTPLENLELPAGSHKVRLENPQRDLSRTLSLTIRPGELTREVVDLE